jgi:putative restriction endonuclease
VTKGVFTTKALPGYDDLPELRYHFPNTYLRKAMETVGDWVLYYEPRRETTEDSGRAGRQSYFATARVDRIEPDPHLEDHYYAFVSDFLEFERPVHFRHPGGVWESALALSDGKTNRGQFQRSVRTIPTREYDIILQQGFATLELPSEAIADEGDETIDRAIVTTLVSRLFRDKAFSARVTKAYDSRCAVTGLRIINGGGRAEVEAAHIRPIADGHRGTDSIRNGIALSRTVHWMFDRGLLSIADDHTLLKAQDRLPSGAQSLFNRSGRLLLPDDQANWPHPQFLRYHREKIFKD